MPPSAPWVICVAAPVDRSIVKIAIPPSSGVPPAASPRPRGWSTAPTVRAKRATTGVRTAATAYATSRTPSTNSSRARRLKAEGYPETLKHTKYCFAKNPENLTDRQKARLDDVLKLDLKSVKAYLLKESFQMLWRYQSPRWARWFLRKWCFKAARSKLDPIKRFVKSMRKHEELIINYFAAKKAFSSGIVEGLNRNVNLATRKAYGFRTYKALEVCLYHNLGSLPEPESTHEFF